MSDPICSTDRNLETIYTNVISNDSYDIESLKPFLCEVMKMAGVDDIDPILYSIGELDYSQYVLNFDSLSAVGDPRISLGAVLKMGFNEFFPRAVAQVEVIRNGGCNVIDGYICNSQGVKIKALSTQCPDNFSMTPITAEEIVNRTSAIVQQSFNEHALRFSNYVKSFYSLGWSASLHYYSRFPMFYVKLENGAGSIYLKYYQDARQTVATNLGLGINIRTDLLFDSPEHSIVMMDPIPAY